MRFQFSDGGRADAGYRGRTGDCVTRAIAHATELPYQTVYDLVNRYGAKERLSKRRKTRGTARTGIHIPTLRRLLADLGWSWHPTMHIGSGCTVHLRESELPTGRLIVSVSRHLTAVINGTIYDTYNPDRDGTRCVYGYWTKP